MAAAQVLIRKAGEADFDTWFDLYETVAAEGQWIGGELPVDRQTRRPAFVEGFVAGANPGLAVLAEVDGRPVGHLGLSTGGSQGGLADLGLLVLAEWRGYGVGSALMTTAIDWARQVGVYKIALQYWPHNLAAKGLYLKFGFVEEGYLHRHYRRRNGELWDAVVMGLVLDTTSPGRCLE